MKKSSLDELLVAYEAAATTHGATLEPGDYKVGNKAATLLVAIYAELRRRGENAQRSLLPLLTHADPGVRMWAATHALEFAPSEGEVVLRELVSSGKLIGLSAKITLGEWEKGRLQFP